VAAVVTKRDVEVARGLSRSVTLSAMPTVTFRDIAKIKNATFRHDS